MNLVQYRMIVDGKKMNLLFINSTEAEAFIMNLMDEGSTVHIDGIQYVTSDMVLNNDTDFTVEDKVTVSMMLGIKALRY